MRHHKEAGKKKFELISILIKLSESTGREGLTSDWNRKSHKNKIPIPEIIKEIIWDSLRDLVPNVQFKKTWATLMEGCYFW